MVVSLKANRTRIIAFLILAAVVVGACIFLWGGNGAQEEKREFPGGTNEERVAFLQSFGWQVGAEPAETREVMIPAQFNDVYTTYNVMQKAQGFDLKPYAGEVCTQYKYRIDNYPDETEVYATLLVYGNLIIGGDVACAEVDGFMHGFAPDSARYGETAENAGQESSSMESPATESSATASSAAESSLPEGAAESAVESAAESAVTEGTGQAEGSAVESQAESAPAESAAGETLSEGAFPTD